MRLLDVLAAQDLPMPRRNTDPSPRRSWVLATVVVVLVAACGSPAPPPAPSVAARTSPSPISSPRPAGTPLPSPIASPSADGEGQPTPDQEPPVVKAIPLNVQLRDVVAGSGTTYAIGDDRRGGVIWAAANGSDWVIDSDGATFDGAQLQAAARNRSGVVVVGCLLRAGLCARGLVWIRGTSWQRVTNRALFDRAVFDGVVATESTFVAYGHVGPRSTIWSSRDGRTWNSVDSFPTDPSTRVAAIAASASELVAVGSLKSRPTSWSSSEGQAWTAQPMPGTRPNLMSIAWGDGGFVAGGSVEGSDPEDVSSVLRLATVWSSPDGIDWTQRTLERTEDELRSVATVGHTVFGIGTGDQGYSSIDGGPWSMVSFERRPSRVVPSPTGFLGIVDRGIAPVGQATFNAPPDPLRLLGVPEWRSLPAMPLLRPGYTGASDGKGGVLLFSDAGGGALRIDRLDLGRQTWSRKPTIRAGITHPTAVADSRGRIYLVGVTPDGRHGRLIRYLSSDGTWKALAPVPTPRTSAAVTMSGDGLIYVLGGTVSPCCDGVKGDGALDIVERFDTKSGTWTRRAPMPLPAAAPGAAIARTALYLFLPARVWRYDTSRDAWSPGPAAMSFGVTGEPTRGPDGLIRVFTCSRYDLFDPASDHWQPGQTMKSARCHPVVVMGTDSTMYVFGGIDTAESGRVVESAFAGGG
jgi:hypothetical protein